jgi:hypothetical protein
MTDVQSPERSSAAGPSLVEALERPRYTFNELKQTETWRRQLVDRLTG